ncbi:MAG: AMP-binding protein, partial [Planctomycetia bacterium]|nr:AMP-binding protein [Planctomycetia bacterium]
MTSPALVNVAAHLPKLAQRQPDTLAVLCPIKSDREGRADYLRWTYRQLNEESDLLAHGLEAVGVRRGVRTVLMVKPSLEFFALTFALFKIGAVPVLVDPGMGVKHLGKCLAEAEPAVFIGIPRAHVGRVLFGWAKQTLRTLVTVGRKWGWGGHTLADIRQRGAGRPAFPLAPTTGEEVAAILFTSGSTGPPKGAVYTHGIFASQVAMLRDLYDIRPGEIDLCTFPLFALFAPALGMTAVIPDMDATRPGSVRPANVIAPIRAFSVTNMFGSPALLRRVVSAGQPLPSLKRVISAGAPVPADLIERFTALLPAGAQLYTPYGATEALPVCSIGSDEILKETRFRTAEGAGVCVGRPVAGMQVRIIRISDEPIAAWSDDLLSPRSEIGEITVQGPVVTREYFNRPEATALHKITAPDGFWHRMGDVGYFDEQGRLWFCGRKAHRVRTATQTLFTIPCEAVFNTHSGVSRTALVGVGPPGQARPVLCVELKEERRHTDQEQVRRELLQLGAARPHTREIATILFHRGFPVDIRHNAK